MNAKEVVKTAMRKLATTMINVDPREWPPTCTIILYQPQRPTIQKDDSNVESK